MPFRARQIALQRRRMRMLRAQVSARLGPEIAPALTAGNWTVSGSDATHIVTFSAGTMRYQSDTTSPVLAVQKASMLVVGYTYDLVITTSVYVGGSLKLDTIGPNIVISSGLGTITVRGVATATNFSMSRNSANVDLTISSLSVRRVT